MEWGTYSMTPSLTELSLLVPLPEPAGGHLGENTSINLGWARPRLYWYPFSIVCRTQWEIFGRSFHAVKILLEVPASRDSLVSGFICSCASQNDVLKRQTERNRLNWPLWNPPRRGRASQRPLRFRWALRYALTGDCYAWGTRGGRVGRPDPWGHRRETGTVKGGVNRSTSKGKSSLAWAPRASGPFPHSLLRINNGPQIRFTLWRLQLSVFTVYPVFMWGSTISNALFLCGTVEGAGFRVWGCSRSAIRRYSYLSRALTVHAPLPDKQARQGLFTVQWMGIMRMFYLA